MEASVIAEAKRIAAGFEYPAAEVNRGVKEFLNQINEGLEKQGTTLSQIPSYVTAVPNGTEKVWFGKLLLLLFLPYLFFFPLV